jgi:hypothetical protein
MPSPRKLLLPLACVCWVALSKPAQEQNQEARPELGVFADGDLNKSLDLGNSEDLGEASLLDEKDPLPIDDRSPDQQQLRHHVGSG